MHRVQPVVAVALGWLLTYVDSRPSWDDTGVTAGLLFLSALVFGYLEPRRPWLSALALGIWIPLWSAFRTQHFEAVIALVPAFLGAFAGVTLRKWLAPANV